LNPQKSKKTLLIVLFLFSFTLPSYAENPRALKIGIIGPETGEDAEIGLTILAGIELAVKEFNNAGGIDGRKIEIVHIDNKSDSGLTQVAVQQLIKEQVIAMIAAPTGWSTFGPVWLANAAKVIFMSAGSKRHIGRSGPYIFRNSLSDDIGTEETIRYALEKLKYKNYAIITSMRDDETSLQIGGLFRGAIMKYDGKIVGETHIFMGVTHEEAIAQLKKDATEKIDAIIFAGDDVAAIEILKELRTQGINAPLIGGDILYTENFLKNGGEIVAGTMLYAGFFPGDKSPLVSRFVSQYKKKTGKEPGLYSAVAYDSFMLIAEAIKQAKTPEPSGVMEALAGMKDMEGVTGKISMDKSGEAIKKPYILRAVKKGGAVKFELVERGQ
jgi:branched-chain amino acid transport system substrate-binding protein